MSQEPYKFTANTDPSIEETEQTRAFYRQSKMIYWSWIGLVVYGKKPLTSHNTSWELGIIMTEEFHRIQREKFSWSSRRKWSQQLTTNSLQEVLLVHSCFPLFISFHLLSLWRLPFSSLQSTHWAVIASLVNRHT